MFQNQPPKQMNEIARNVTCKVPLCCIDECERKKCDNGKNNTKPHQVQEQKQKHFETTDHYWAEFLKAQQTSSANYIYQMQIYGDSQEPTLARKDPFPPELIHQRLLHMPIVGALEKVDIFYILCFLLNLLQLKPEKQEKYMEMFQIQGLLDNEILNYMQIIARHPNTCIPHHLLEDFLELTHNLINRASTVCSTNFFNPDRIFMRSMTEMDPYELAYLKAIMEAEAQLNTNQFIYLVKFVGKLQEIPLSQRDQYLKALYDRSILPSPNFPALVYYIKKKGKKCNRQKLIALWSNLIALLDIGTYFPQPIEEPKIVERVTEIHIDVLKLKKALEDLMKGGIPNIIRVMDLKKFLHDMMHLNAEQLEQTLNQMKDMNLIALEQFKFIQNFIAKESLKADEEQKKLLLKTLQKVGSTPPNAVLAIPLSKGPHPPVTPSAGAMTSTDIGKSKEKASDSGPKRKSKSKSTPEVGIGKDVAPTNSSNKDESPQKDKTDEKNKETKTKTLENIKSTVKSNNKSKAKRQTKR